MLCYAFQDWQKQPTTYFLKMAWINEDFGPSSEENSGLWGSRINGRIEKRVLSSRALSCQNPEPLRYGRNMCHSHDGSIDVDNQWRGTHSGCQDPCKIAWDAWQGKGNKSKDHSVHIIWHLKFKPRFSPPKNPYKTSLHQAPNPRASGKMRFPFASPSPCDVADASHWPGRFCFMGKNPV